MPPRNIYRKKHPKLIGFAGRHRTTAKILYNSLAALLLLAAIIFVLQLGEGDTGQHVFGVTFREPYAKALGLDWKQVYLNTLDDLKVRNLRLPVYWDDLEQTKNSYDFRDIDFQMAEASARNAKVVMAIGRRVPGWPECHIPGWAEQLTPEQQQPYLLSAMQVTVNRYKNSPALAYWQVENEPYLTRFGSCPQYDVSKFLNEEVDLVHKLDPNHPVIITENGEISIWVVAASHGDIFATTLYRKVFAQSFQKYINYHFPTWFYRAKKGLVHLFFPNKQILDLEMQGEPWTTRGITNTGWDEQAITYPPGSLQANLNFAYASGFSTNYFWGVEYWYWAAQHGHPEFLQEAKGILLNAAQQQAIR